MRSQLQTDLDRTQKLLKQHFGKAIASSNSEHEGDQPAACGHPQA